jgi:hypothetical protein
MSSKALEEWYDEVAGAPSHYYYLAAFDKTRGSAPVGESIAPPKPGMPGFDIRSQWRYPPFNKAKVAGSRIGVDQPGSRREPAWYVPALLGATLGVAYFATSREAAKIKRERSASRK